MDSEGSLEILGNDETPEILVYIVAAFHVISSVGHLIGLGIFALMMIDPEWCSGKGCDSQSELYDNYAWILYGIVVFKLPFFPASLNLVDGVLNDNVELLEYWNKFMVIGTIGHVAINRLLTYYYGDEKYAKLIEKVDNCQIMFDISSIIFIHEYKNRLKLRLSNGNA
ncbi:uncharacterized protein LOC110850273 [Folsomia candida]|uniref:uncharacterized protein LOC110850273 n=1 Tax=Folsomia candida TaxID=158441 RepID=UPI0016053DCE|nr:uncharacterized protein LOC110850273 [Folsomia candida]